MPMASAQGSTCSGNLAASVGTGLDPRESDVGTGLDHASASAPSATTPQSPFQVQSTVSFRMSCPVPNSCLCIIAFRKNSMSSARSGRALAQSWKFFSHIVGCSCLRLYLADAIRFWFGLNL